MLGTMVHMKDGDRLCEPPEIDIVQILTLCSNVWFALVTVFHCKRSEKQMLIV